jgi:hypothetical protein
MLRRIVVPTLVVTLFLATGCENSEPASPSTDTPAFAKGAPATGNGNKEVILIDEDLERLECPGGEFLDVHQTGWIQIRLFSQTDKRNVQLDIYHLNTTWTNSAGETFVFGDRGPDHYYFDDGILYVSIAGRAGGETGLLGRMVINTETGEVVFIAGNEFGGAEARACEALT